MRPVQDDDERVIVVGTGPTGAMAAATLVAEGVPVTIIESGLRRPRGLIVRAAGNTVVRLTPRHGMRVGREHSTSVPTEWHSSRVPGGLSGYWTGSIPRFAPSDFDDGARLDDRFRWPIGYDDLAPHYDAVEHLMGVTAGHPLATVPDPVVRHRHDLPAAWESICRAVSGLDEGRSMGVMPMAKGTPWMVALRATEFNSFDLMVEPIRDDPAVRLLLGRHALRLERSRPGGPVDTVVVVNHGSHVVERHRARAIVLAAGALDSTEILLRSTGDDDPDGLGGSSGVLGRYLHDHPRQWWRARLERPMPALSHPLYLTRPDTSRHEPLRTAGFTVGLGRRVDRLRTWVRGSSDEIGVLTFATMVPTPDGRVELVGDRRSNEHSDLSITFSFDDATAGLMASSQQQFLDTLAAAGLPARVDFELPVGAPGSSVHLGGTARMHASREHGVVDGANRVHDAPEVLVVDAACFTTGPEKNPTPTAMAIARRAAQLLAADLA